ncbi:MAG TPA: methionyl-tRNA formyltransferase [Vicinamibacterales bacterium]|nr:methionyl-tRNA formyltransferase [Vicinamibacterales bacterium]
MAYFGTPEFAVPGLRALIASTHDVVALVSQPDRPRGRGHKLQPTPTKLVAVAAGIPVLQPTRLKDDAFADALRALSLDLAVVAAYGRIIPDRVLEIPRLGMINIHASLLPKYRGAAPIHRAVINGDKETGVTIMRVVSELDAGPAFAVERIPIGPDDTTPEVERALAETGANLAVRVVGQLAEGSAVEVPQNHAQATYAPKLERHEGAIDWSLPANDIHNRVRGLQPWPLVSVTIDRVRCSIYRTSVSGETTTAPPATVIAASNGVLAVAAGDGRVVRILEIQPEGKRVMSARDFLAGRRVQCGDRLP